MLTIGMLAMSLVGGIGLNMMAKVNVHRDWLRLNNVLKEASYQSYLCGCTYQFYFYQNIVTQSHEEASKQYSFDNLEFPEQAVTYYSTGMPDKQILYIKKDGKDMSIDLIDMLLPKS